MNWLRIKLLTIVGLFLVLPAAFAQPPPPTTTPRPVNLFGDDSRFCGESKLLGVQFPRTRVCSDAVVPCPNPDLTDGVMTRRCECGTAKWAPKADTNNCTHKWVWAIREGVARGERVDYLSANLTSNLKITVAAQIYGGDIVGSVIIGGQLLPLARSQFMVLTDRSERDVRAVNFTQNLGSAGDVLLSESVSDVWLGLDTNVRVSQAANLMSTLEQMAMLLAEYTTNNTRKIDYSNWAMQIQVQPPPTIQTMQAPVSRGFAGVLPGGSDSFDDSILRPHTSFTSPSQSEQRQSISFAGYSKSPQISLPSIDVLQSSAQDSNSFQMGGASPLFHPGISASSPTGTPLSLDRTPTRLGYYVFTSLGTLLNLDQLSIVNSHIVGASVNSATSSISLPDQDNATFTFYHLVTDDVSNPRCVYWDLGNGKWSQDGCTLIATDRDKTVCTCNHLTSFAVLMDVSGRLGGGGGEVLDIVTKIGCALSIVCLGLSLLVFVFFRSLWGVRNTIHRNLCLCLLLGELIFVIGVDRTANKTGCSIVALLLHYFFLAAFCWMLLEGYQLYMMLIQVFEPNKTRILLYYLWAYGFPAVVVAVSAGVAWQNYGTPDYCWLNTKTATIWAFIGPVIIVIAANIVFLLIALRVVLSVKSRERTPSQRLVGWLKGSAMLLCLLGITWVFGFLTAVKSASLAFAWIFTVLNCTQGVFIFFFHVVGNEKVRIVLVRWLRAGVCCCADANASSSSLNSRSFDRSRQRILNMVRPQKSNAPSDPSTASTDDTVKKDGANSSPQTYDELVRRLRAPNGGQHGGPTMVEAGQRKHKKSGEEENRRAENANLKHGIENVALETKDEGISEGVVVLADEFNSSCGESMDGRASSSAFGLSSDSCRGGGKRAHVRRIKFPLGSNDAERSSSRRIQQQKF